MARYYYYERIGISNVIRDTYRLFRENFGLLIRIALFGQVLTLAQSTYTFLVGLEFSTFTIFLLPVAEMFIWIWVSTALISSTASVHNGIHLSIAELKKAVGIKYWGVFVALLKLFFILLVPALGILLLEQISPIGASLLALPGLGLIFYLGVKYSFAIESATLEERASEAFRNSSRLVAGRFWGIVGATLAFEAIFLIVPLIDLFYVTERLINQPAGVIYLYDIAMSLYGAVVLALQTIFMTLLYLRVKEMDAGSTDSAQATCSSSMDESDTGNGGYHDPKI